VVHQVLLVQLVLQLIVVLQVLRVHPQPQEQVGQLVQLVLVGLQLLQELQLLLVHPQLQVQLVHQDCLN